MTPIARGGEGTLLGLHLVKRRLKTNPLLDKESEWKPEICGAFSQSSGGGEK